jgi:hypothetical protein
MPHDARRRQATSGRIPHPRSSSKVEIARQARIVRHPARTWCVVKVKPPISEAANSCEPSTVGNEILFGQRLTQRGVQLRHLPLQNVKLLRLHGELVLSAVEIANYGRLRVHLLALLLQLVEQQGRKLVIAHALDPSRLIAGHKFRIDLGDFLGNQSVFQIARGPRRFEGAREQYP